MAGGEGRVACGTPTTTVATSRSPFAPVASTPRLTDNEHGARRQIPRIIHQFWSDRGGKQRPSHLMDRCRSLNPNWKYMLWDPYNVSNGDIVLENRKVFDCFATKQINGQSDVLRYEVLKQFGGFYVDADTLCLRSFEDLRNESFVVSYHHYHNPNLKGTKRYEDKFIASGVIGSHRNGDVVRKLVETLRNDPTRCKGAAWSTVGPKIVTEVLDSPCSTAIQFNRISRSSHIILRKRLIMT